MNREYTDPELSQAAYFLQKVMANPTEFKCHWCTLCKAFSPVWVALFAPDDVNLEAFGVTVDNRFLPYALCTKCYADDWSFMPAVERTFAAQAVAHRRPRLILLPHDGNQAHRP